MRQGKIHTLGNEDIVLLFGLLGIEGTVIENHNKFLDKFNQLTQDSSIKLLIISLELSEELIDELINFKLTNKTPFIFYFPKIYKKELGKRDQILKNVRDSLQRITP